MFKTFINITSFMKKNIDTKIYWMNPIYMVLPIKLMIWAMNYTKF